MTHRHHPSVSTAVAIATVLLLAVHGAQAVSLALPDPEYGVCLGNARNFSGLRINLRDHDVERIKRRQPHALDPRRRTIWPAFAVSPSAWWRRRVGG